MPTVCELKIKAKAKGLVGYSNMKKVPLTKLVGGEKPKEKPKAKPKSKEKPKEKPNGLTPKQKANLPIALQKAILAKRKKM